MNSKYLNEKTVKEILDADRAASNELSGETEVRTAIASYQTEFPYEIDEEAQVTRREFCNFLFLTSSALFLGAAGFAATLAYKARFDEHLDPLKIAGSGGMQAGSSVNFFYPGENDTAILIRAADGNYYAFEQKCTHLTCPVYYAKESDRIECPCHEGGFDVHTGNVLYGPPPRPLGQIMIEEREGEIWAIGKRRTGGEHGSA